MYYEEKIINGILHCQLSPTGDWVKVDYKKLLDRLIDAENALNWLEREFKQAIGTGPAHHVICEVHTGSKSLRDAVRTAA